MPGKNSKINKLRAYILESRVENLVESNGVTVVEVQYNKVAY